MNAKGDCMNKNKSFAMFGGREVLEEEKTEIKAKLYAMFEDLICNKGVVYFYFGGYRGIDDICHEVFMELQKKYPLVKSWYIDEDYSLVDISQKKPIWLDEAEYNQFIFFD